LKRGGIRQNIGDKTPRIAGLHRLGIEHDETKTAFRRTRGKRLAEANLQRQQAALTAADTVAAGKKRARGARKAFGA